MTKVEAPKTFSLRNSAKLKAPFQKINIFVVLVRKNHEFPKKERFFGLGMYFL